MSLRGRGHGEADPPSKTYDTLIVSQRFPDQLPGSVSSAVLNKFAEQDRS
jgi:hypothetical protein